MKDLMAKKYEDHRLRVKNIQPQVDTKKPHELPDSGKREIERKRNHAAIERDNRELLTRLGKAMQIKNIDNESKVAKGISLQAALKKIELERITNDNRRLLDRLQKTIPAYDHIAWEQEAEEREKILMNMTEFPELYVPKYTPAKKFEKICTKFALQSKIKRQSANDAQKHANAHTHNNTSNTSSSSSLHNSKAGDGNHILPPADEPRLLRPMMQRPNI